MSQYYHFKETHCVNFKGINCLSNFPRQPAASAKHSKPHWRDTNVFQKHGIISTAVPHAPPPAKGSLRVPAGSSLQDVHRFALRYAHSALSLLDNGIALKYKGETILISDHGWASAH